MAVDVALLCRPGQASLAGFANHLHTYLPLLRQLERFDFLYIASSTVHFIAAERCFSSLVRTPREADVSTEILRYFQLRNSWELKRYGSLSATDIEWLKEATQRFHGEQFEGSFHAWAAGQLSERGLRSEFAQMQPSRCVRFRTCLVDATRFGRKTSTEWGEEALHPPTSPHSSTMASPLR
jgi:hypothetical protein